MTFTESDYNALAALVFRDDYPGNATARGVVEAPDGDPGARDTGKKFSHVALKYLKTYGRDVPGASGRVAQLERYAVKAWRAAREVGEQLHINNTRFAPKLEYGCLRVLEYPAVVGANAIRNGSAQHTDADLFTINLWRNVPNPGLPGGPGSIHMGRLGELLGLGAAVPHHVDPLPVVQRSLVYFAIPDHAARLPGGGTVGEWLAEQMKTMRYSADNAGDGQ